MDVTREGNERGGERSEAKDGVVERWWSGVEDGGVLETPVAAASWEISPDVWRVLWFGRCIGWVVRWRGSLAAGGGAAGLVSKTRPTRRCYAYRR